MEWKPYFLWQLPSLTKIIGVSITSRDEEAGNGIESINGIQVRAGTVSMQDVCITLSSCSAKDENGTCMWKSGIGCDPWKVNTYCGVLNITENILPLREYSIICQKGILARVITVQLFKPGQHSLTFNEISVIRESFFIKPKHSTLSNNIHGSPGILNYAQNYQKICIHACF